LFYDSLNGQIMAAPFAVEDDWLVPRGETAALVEPGIEFDDPPGRPLVTGSESPAQRDFRPRDEYARREAAVVEQRWKCGDSQTGHDGDPRRNSEVDVEAAVAAT
jgi:hypothetical protein